MRGSSQFVFVFGVPAFATHEKEQLMVWCLRVVVVNLEILLKTLATMVRKEKQWEVEDKNFKDNGNREFSADSDSDLRSSLSQGGWCPFTPASICMQNLSSFEFKCCGYFVLSEFGLEFFVIWICSIFVPSPISGLPEFEVTRLGV